jgi:hypothetical protein
MKKVREMSRAELAAYYFWNDLQCMEQALLVAKYKDIDLDEVERWSIKEGEEEKFNLFLKRVKKLEKET